MIKILIAYTTNSGSTFDFAQRICDSLVQEGAEVDVRLIGEVQSVDGYQAVLVGAPMIMGWHKTAVGFVKKHQESLSRVKVAYFLTAMSLTETGIKEVDGIPVFIDPGLPKEPVKPGRLGFKERYATAANYIQPVLKTAPRVRPVSVGIFGGKLELFRLNLFQMLFVMLVIQAQPGDKRSWRAVGEWTDTLYTRLVNDS
jgi:menaquinone-dependent protoporphyrinogen oxidase